MTVSWVRAGTAAEDSLQSVQTLCFGEAIVDLICRRPVTSLADVDAFAPHAGGVAQRPVAAARAGAQSRWPAAPGRSGGSGARPARRRELRPALVRACRRLRNRGLRTVDIAASRHDSDGDGVAATVIALKAAADAARRPARCLHSKLSGRLRRSHDGRRARALELGAVRSSRSHLRMARARNPGAPAPRRRMVKGVSSSSARPREALRARATRARGSVVLGGGAKHVTHPRRQRRDRARRGLTRRSSQSVARVSAVGAVDSSSARARTPRTTLLSRALLGRRAASRQALARATLCAQYDPALRRRARRLERPRGRAGPESRAPAGVGVPVMERRRPLAGCPHGLVAVHPTIATATSRSCAAERFPTGNAFATRR